MGATVNDVPAALLPLRAWRRFRATFPAAIRITPRATRRTRRGRFFPAMHWGRPRSTEKTSRTEDRRRRACDLVGLSARCGGFLCHERRHRIKRGAKVVTPPRYALRPPLRCPGRAESSSGAILTPRSPRSEPHRATPRSEPGRESRTCIAPPLPLREGRADRWPGLLVLEPERATSTRPP